jgi:L-serine dehydratase
MESIKEIYKKGHGPSGNPTMGPKKPAEKFKARNPQANRVEVFLY